MSRNLLSEMRGASIAPESGAADRGVKPIPGRGGEQLEARAPASGILGNLRSFLEYRDWSTGESGTLILSTQLSIGELYERISSAQGLVSPKRPFRTI